MDNGKLTVQERRLIDADALTDEVLNHPKPYRKDFYKMLRDAPTVDAVEVVRCKDCKHYMTIHCTCDGCCISADWYCADGERRTDV